MKIIELMNKKRKIILTALFLIYCVGYIGAREMHIIVHRSGFHTDSKGAVLTSTHFVVNGDFGVPAFNIIFSLLQIVIGFVYIPAKFIEKQYWYLVVPINSTWPYSNAI